MKRLNKILISLLLAISLLFSYAVPVFSVETKAATQTYSKQYNSGERDEVCLSLDGTSALSYYTYGSYDWDALSELSASQLKSKLATLMKSTHSYTSSYDDCHYKANRTDCENGDGSVSLIYTAYSATMSEWNGWNREHVWPKSLGGNNTSGGGADLHHIRPSDAGVNSSRGNKKYGNSNNGAEKYGTNPAIGYLGGTYSSVYFEPRDEVKGDVARICLYVYVRWGSDWGASDITKVFQSVDVLLEWCEMDPVDTWEMGRNEVVQDIQGNRNVFIDYPEYAWLIFGREVPDDMTTPSGEAKDSGSDTPVVPEHKCESVCSTCGKCLDKTCTESACVSKCQGHTPVVEPHKCESVCSTCGKCLDKTCTESACVSKCQGHTPVVEPHKCESVCSTCGKCLDKTCTESACASKCQGHTPVVEPHKCESICGTCGKCLDKTCTESACASKCQGHCTHQNTTVKNAVEPTCAATGYSGDTYCTDCDMKISGGSFIAKTDDHIFTTWTLNEEGTERFRTCTVCGKVESVEVKEEEPENPPITDPIDPPKTKPETPEDLVGSLDSDAEKILIFLIFGTTEGLFVGETVE